jgi:hypothetical protein
MLHNLLILKNLDSMDSNCSLDIATIVYILMYSSN